MGLRFRVWGLGLRGPGAQGPKGICRDHKEFVGSPYYGFYKDNFGNARIGTIN